MKHNWQEWIDRIGRDDVSEQELLDFQAALNESPEAKKEYMECLYTEANLEIHGDPSILSSPALHESSVVSTFPDWRRWVMPVAASIALLIGLSYFVANRNVPTTGAAAILETVAVITDTNSAADAGGIKTGPVLQMGELNVPSDAEIGITMNGGALLKIKGPAQLRMEGPDTVFLRKGRILTYAPEHAHGFAINTKDGKIVDLGTRFVTATGGEFGTEIHVIEGLVKVEAVNSRENRAIISQEQAVSLQGGSVTSIDYLSDRFTIPIHLNLLDSDGDLVSDSIEAFYKTDANDRNSKPDFLRISESFNGYQPGPFHNAAYLGSGDIDDWLGHGTFLNEGLSYQNNGEKFVTSGGCVQTSEDHSDGVTVILSSKELPEEGVVYISFLMKGSASSAKTFSGLLLYLGDENEQLFVGDLGDVGYYGSRFSVNERQDSFGISVDDKTHLFVIRVDKTRHLTDIYVDPPLGKPAKGARPQKRYQSVPKFDRIQLRSAYGFPVRFDELRVGLTWESVTPVTP